MKYVILILVLVCAAWWAFGRRRRPIAKSAPPADKAKAPPEGEAPAAMLACAHCGVHLPPAEALLDGESRVFCSEAHRLSGPA